MTTALAPAVCALRAFSWKPQVPRRINAILPAKLPGAGATALQASLAEVWVPVRAIGNVPEVGAAGEAVAWLYATRRSSGEMVKERGVVMWELSNDATPITLLPKPGALAAY